MAWRSVPRLTAVLGAILVASGLASAAEEAPRPPTALERVLQARHLDRYYLLRSDVKIQRVRSRRIVSSTLTAP